MNPKTYFSRMRETSEAVDEVIFKSLEPLKQQNSGMYDAVATLPEKRKGLPKVRAHIAREAYAICNWSDSNSNWVDLAAAVELTLNEMYYKNQIFDSKAGCSNNDKERLVENWTADSYSRDLAEQVLRENYAEKPELIDILRESNMIFTRGEYLDVLQNTYSEVKDLSFEKQMKLCTQRIYEINASFFEKCAKMGAILAGETNDSKIQALSEFGRDYGTALQIVNDIADFVPPRLNRGTTEKTNNDAYADVKTQKMTFPVIWLLNKGSEDNKKLLIDIFEKGSNVGLPQLEELTKVLVKSGAIDFAKGKAKWYAHEAKRSLKGTFSNKNERGNLSAMCSMAYKNRYYDALKEFEGE